MAVAPALNEKLSMFGDSMARSARFVCVFGALQALYIGLGSSWGEPPPIDEPLPGR